MPPLFFAKQNAEQITNNRLHFPVNRDVWSDDVHLLAWARRPLSL